MISCGVYTKQHKRVSAKRKRKLALDLPQVARLDAAWEMSWTEEYPSGRLLEGPESPNNETFHGTHWLASIIGTIVVVGACRLHTIKVTMIS